MLAINIDTVTRDYIVFLSSSITKKLKFNLKSFITVHPKE